MKKVLLAVVLSVMGVSAADVKDQRVGTMKAYESALSSIQKGFLYNSESMVMDGVKSFQKNLRHSDSFIIDLKKDETTERFNPRTYANTEAKAISTLVDEIENNYKTGTKNKSVEAYNNVVKRCLACHRIIRKW